jgi:uncharacterized protein (TIGR02391 family)
MATLQKAIEAHHLESVCRTIADTNVGLTGSEIQKILADCKIKDVNPDLTKWKRLYNAFVVWQNENQCSNAILHFVQAAMQPVRYIGNEDLFTFRLFEINKRLAFIGIELLESGKFRKVQVGTTISEVEQRVNRFNHKLQQRNVHSEVLRFCKAELLANNYFHSVLEAMKSILERIRRITGISLDGVALIDSAFPRIAPAIKINAHFSETEISQHQGLAKFIKGLIAMMRNPTAHEPKILFAIEEDEALDVMTSISFVHKQLDKAEKLLRS